MERTIPEQVQPTTWSVGEKLKDLVEKFRVQRIINNLDSLRHSELPDYTTVPDGPMASVTIQKNWPNGMTVVSGKSSSESVSSTITITALWGENNRVIAISATRQGFVDGQEKSKGAWSADHLSGVQASGMSTSEVSGRLKKASRVLLGSLEQVPAEEQEDY